MWYGQKRCPRLTYLVVWSLTESTFFPLVLTKKLSCFFTFQHEMKRGHVHKNRDYMHPKSRVQSFFGEKNIFFSSNISCDEKFTIRIITEKKMFFFLQIFFSPQKVTKSCSKTIAHKLQLPALGVRGSPMEKICLKTLAHVLWGSLLQCIQKNVFSTTFLTDFHWTS